MRERQVLTTIWLGSFVTALIVLESYIGRKNAVGIVVLLSADRMDVFKPVATLYGTYLAAILGFWFTKPFAAVRNGHARRSRFIIAAGCTLLFNIVVLYLIGHELLRPGGNVLDDVHAAVRAAALLSFVVAPANLYYFGMKPAPAVD